MKKSIIQDIEKLISDISYGDVTRNDTESRLERIKEEIEENLKEV